ncbi:unnamed protein product [Nezara viridula]|uniref:Uncharacterized protein n=1 Tax=Nezara viridula TaxID=85310 RepID=A0A9P0MPN5_NEZVI|nr:unnamed protein product [Nezara viridula]
MQSPGLMLLAPGSNNTTRRDIAPYTTPLTDGRVPRHAMPRHPFTNPSRLARTIRSSTVTRATPAFC